MARRNPSIWFVACLVIFVTGLAVFIFTNMTIPIKASVSINRTGVLVGDSIRYELVINARKDVTIEVPDLSACFGGFSMRNNKRTVEDLWGRRIYRYIFIIAKDEPGNYEISPLAIRYRNKNEGRWQEQKVRGFSLTVSSILGAEDNPEGKIRIGSDIVGRRGGSKVDSGERSMTVDSAFNYKIKDIADPKSVLTWQDIIFFTVIGLAGLVLLIAAITFLYDKIFRKKTVEMPIDIVAMGRLKKLEPKSSVEVTNPKDFCFALSFAVKDYLKSFFKMETKEKTTREFMSELSGVKGLSDKDKERAHTILVLCDLVKYSDYAPNTAELSKAAALAKDIVISTRPAPSVGSR